MKDNSMHFSRLLKFSLLVFLMTARTVVLSRNSLLAQESASNEGLTETEKESVQKSRNPEEKLKVYLDIANERMKIILLATRKEKAEELAQAVTGFRSALDSAEEVVSGEQSNKANAKKLNELLLKATRKYNASLLEILKKAAEDLRKYIQAAFEVSERVSDGLTLQLQKNRH